MLFGWLLKRLIRVGCLRLIDSSGKLHVFRGEPGPEATIRLHSRSLDWTLAINPYLGCGEAYMEGSLTVENGSIYDFVAVAGANFWTFQDHHIFGLVERTRRLIRQIHQFNPVSRARTNVAHHYDLSSELYDLFLDSDRQYSCAYFADPKDDLETAQENKRNHIAAKLLLEDGQKVLDIGSGWGGLALALARKAKVKVTGVTLSTEQLEMSTARAKREQLDSQVKFALRDYRNQTGPFDRIVSVGMFEHVGVGFYGAFFKKIRSLLTDDGVALLHTIGRIDGPGATSPWIRKYIFPGGYIPALSEIVRVIEKERMVVTDVEVLRLHYAETLRHWRDRFQANRRKAAAIYDERFCRMWEFYLAASEAAFRYMGLVVYQVQMTRRQDAVPLTRDYIYGSEKSSDSRDGSIRAA